MKTWAPYLAFMLISATSSAANDPQFKDVVWCGYGSPTDSIDQAVLIIQKSDFMRSGGGVGKMIIQGDLLRKFEGAGYVRADDLNEQGQMVLDLPAGNPGYTVSLKSYFFGRDERGREIKLASWEGTAETAFGHGMFILRVSQASPDSDMRKKPEFSGSMYTFNYCNIALGVEFSKYD
jgi:hypothetical protein